MAVESRCLSGEKKLGTPKQLELLDPLVAQPALLPPCGSATSLRGAPDIFYVPVVLFHPEITGGRRWPRRATTVVYEDLLCVRGTRLLYHRSTGQHLAARKLIALVEGIACSFPQ